MIIFILPPINWYLWGVYRFSSLFFSIFPKMRSGVGTSHFFPIIFPHFVFNLCSGSFFWYIFEHWWWWNTSKFGIYNDFNFIRFKLAFQMKRISSLWFIQLKIIIFISFLVSCCLLRICFAFPSLNLFFVLFHSWINTVCIFVWLENRNWFSVRIVFVSKKKKKEKKKKKKKKKKLVFNF